MKGIRGIKLLSASAVMLAARESAIYGRCPKCMGLGVTRERRPNGNDTCVNGHTYSSSDAITTPTPHAGGTDAEVGHG